MSLSTAHKKETLPEQQRKEVSTSKYSGSTESLRVADPLSDPEYSPLQAKLFLSLQQLTIPHVWLREIVLALCWYKNRFTPKETKFVTS